jgi:SAM-dependent methyltransferase
LRAAKQYTEAILTPLLLQAPMVHRSYSKPLGYPGDYQVMLYYYGDSFEGDTAFAKVVHKLFVRHPLSAGVCTRKDYVLDWMLRQHDQVVRSGGGEFKVTSLGCGPAREVADFFSARREWTGRVVFTLFDQEEETLEVAYAAARRSLALATGKASLECFNLSFGQLLRNTAPLKQGGRQHFVYATGLFDYLNERTAQGLISTLYDNLAPGGLLLIGNAIGPNRHLFEPEFILDWTLIYRTQEEMRRLAAQLPGAARISVDEEPGGAYWFLRISKPPANSA